MKRLLQILIILCISACASYAQDSVARKKFDEFSKKSHNSFVRKSGRNADKFVALHDRAWRKIYRLSPAFVPADEKRPVRKYDNALLKNRRLPYESLIQPSSSGTRRNVGQERGSGPQPPRAHMQESTDDGITVTFYGTPVRIAVPSNFRISLRDLSRESLDKGWQHCHENLSATLEDCLRSKFSMNLCDWAYINLLDRVASSCAGSDNEAAMMQAYLYAASGYEACLGFTSSDLYLLYSSDRQIYGKPVMDLDGERYYGWGKDLPDSMDVVPLSEDGCRALSLDMEAEPVLAQDLSESRILSSTCGIIVPVRVNRNLVDFYSGYPQSFRSPDSMSRWALYADTPLDGICKADLYPTLKKRILGTGTTASVQSLLNFVQTAFKYEYDDKVWGYDRPFFAEETLFYEFCDCEDRSILFSRLVRDLLGLDVALVYCTGHLAAAVKLEGAVAGEYFELPDGMYYICDPTYIGAPVGASIPGLDYTNAKVIMLKR